MKSLVDTRNYFFPHENIYNTFDCTKSCFIEINFLVIDIGTRKYLILVRKYIIGTKNY